MRSARDLVHHLGESIALIVSLSTVKRYLRQAGWVYKRMRLSLKDKRDPVLFEVFYQELQALKELEDQHQIDLYFFDEMGLTLTPKLPYAWQPKGQTACLPTAHSPLLTTLGFVNRKLDLQSFVFKGAANTHIVVECMEQFAQQINRKTIVILDNAPIHKSTLMMSKIKDWNQKGLFLQFIPAYCPELNYIERLWKHIKYQCLPTEAFKNIDTLNENLENVLKNIKKYHFNFN